MDFDLYYVDKQSNKQKSATRSININDPTGDESILDVCCFPCFTSRSFVIGEISFILCQQNIIAYIYCMRISSYTTNDYVE